MASNVDFAASEHVWVGLKTDAQELMASFEEPSHFIRCHEGAVLLFHGDDATEIGRYRAYYIDAEGAIGANMPLYDVFDTMSETYDYLQLYMAGGDGEHTAAATKAADTDFRYEPNLLILDRLEILPPYRGRGYGLEALIGMMHWFQAGAGLVAMKPFPLQCEADSRRDDDGRKALELDRFPTHYVTARTKLRRYYAQLGFKLVAKTNFMVRRVDQAPPVVPDKYARR